MNFENALPASADFLIKSLADEMFRGAKLIGKIEDSVYQKRMDGAGSIGGHFRHNLDFVNAFLNGLKTGKIDYNRRERDSRVEENRLYAIKRFANTICEFRKLPLETFNMKVLIRSEVNSDFWLESSAMRELEFLHSHTIHHYALIAEKLFLLGVRTEKNFGVALSTLKFWAEENRAA